jgi:DNA-binding transcriptional MerR regulator
MKGVIMKGLSRKQVAQKLGLTDRTVWFYTEQGLVKPEIHNPKGKGTTRLYSAKNVMELAVIRKLGDHGLKLELIREIMRAPIGKLLASRDGFDPWNPAQDIDSGGRRFFLFVYDAASEHPAVIQTGLEPGQELKLIDKWSTRCRDFEVCIVLDLTAVRDKVRAEFV